MSTIKISVFTSHDQENTQIGLIQSITVSGDKLDTMDIQKVWASRMLLDRSKIADVFNRDYVIPAAQKYPIQIVIEEKSDDGTIKSKIRIHNAWLIGRHKNMTVFTSQECIMVEDVDMEAEYISIDEITATAGDIERLEKLKAFW